MATKFTQTAAVYVYNKYAISMYTVYVVCRGAFEATSLPECDRGNVLLNESKNRYPPLTAN